MFKIIFVFATCTLFIHVLLFQKLVVGLKKETLIQKRKFHLFFQLNHVALIMQFLSFFLNEKEPLATIKKKALGSI